MTMPYWHFKYFPTSSIEKTVHLTGSFTRPNGLPLLVMLFLLPVFVLILWNRFSYLFFTVL